MFQFSLLIFLREVIRRTIIISMVSITNINNKKKYKLKTVTTFMVKNNNNNNNYINFIYTESKNKQ